MPDPTDISAELPAPRDDEPEALRSDIVDELTDHLNCASQRETHSQDISDPRTVEQRVLARFGNPAAIARRLWWDAMQEKIMSQRITALAAAIAAAACLVACGLIWRILGVNEAALANSNAANQALVEQVRLLVNEVRDQPQQAAQPVEWNRLRVKCVLGDDDGPPVAGVRINLVSASDNTSGIPPSDRVTDESGVADFGHVLFGKYRLTFVTQSGLQRTDLVSVHPGEDRQIVIATPPDGALGRCDCATDGATG